MFQMHTTIVLSFFGFTQVSLRIPGKAVSVLNKNTIIIWHFGDGEHEQFGDPSLQKIKVIYSLLTFLSKSVFTNYKLNSVTDKRNTE